MPILPSKYPELDHAHDLLSTDPERSLKIANEFLANNSDHSSGLLTKLFAYERLKDWPTALSVAQDMIRVNPLDCQAHNQASALHYRLGNYQEAISCAHQALKVDEDKWLGTVPYQLLAASHAQLGNLPMALSYADQAHAIDPLPFVPYGPLPYGTLDQFKDFLNRIVSSR